ncbi:YtpI family protein [Macrococcus capreoli]|uniref:YtpI family protein n=1 Tax=Macrococcus capreoli TaxID=2982690 RepID=UPI0021D5AD72|nr:YtpI family protein [Macrococcus sp. TMW 2.2395]MCU7558356.1 YtpI family protein [Macrococcus sp. TMW 2.2395]
METIYPYIIMITVTVMIFSLMFTIYNIAKYFREVREVRRAWYRARARQCFAIFMVAFACNQLLLFPRLLTYVICALLIAYAIYNYQYAIKAKKHFESHFDDEDAAWEALRKKQQLRR